MAGGRRAGTGQVGDEDGWGLMAIGGGGGGGGGSDVPADSVARRSNSKKHARSTGGSGNRQRKSRRSGRKTMRSSNVAGAAPVATTASATAPATDSAGEHTVVAVRGDDGFEYEMLGMTPARHAGSGGGGGGGARGATTARKRGTNGGRHFAHIAMTEAESAAAREAAAGTGCTGALLLDAERHKGGAPEYWSLYSGDKLRGLLGSTAGFFFGFSGVVAIGASAKRLEEAFGEDVVNSTMMGLLIAAPNLTGSLLRIPVTAVCDVAGHRRPMLTFLGASCVGMLALTVTVYAAYPNSLTVAHYYLMLLFALLIGCGAANFAVGITQVAYWFPQAEQGKALGVYAGIGNLAPGFFSLVMAFTLAAGLKGSYLLWLVMLLCGWALYYRFGVNAPVFQFIGAGMAYPEAEAQARLCGQELFPQRSVLDALRVSVLLRETWLLVALYFVSFGTFLAMTVWLPTYWDSYHELGVTAIAGVDVRNGLLINACYVFVNGGSRSWVGKYTDRYGGADIATLALGAILAGAALMQAAGSGMWWLAVAGAMLLSSGQGIMAAGTFKLLPTAVPQCVGGASGWVSGLGALGGFLNPVMLSAAVDVWGSEGYRHGFAIVDVYCVLALACLYMLNDNSWPLVAWANGGHGKGAAAGALTASARVAGKADAVPASSPSSAAKQGLPVAPVIAVEDPGVRDVRALLEEHLAHMRRVSPPGCVFALDLDALRDASVTFYTARRASDGALQGCAALRELAATHGEIKSMRTADAHVRCGVAGALLAHIIAEARGRGYARLSLETGDADVFAPAIRLYGRHGFVRCGAYGDYSDDAPFSVFMSLELD